MIAIVSMAMANTYTRTHMQDNFFHCGPYKAQTYRVLVSTSDDRPIPAARASKTGLQGVGLASSNETHENKNTKHQTHKKQHNFRKTK